MEEQYLIEIELPIWQDPQGNLMLEKCREHCYLYFDCWEEPENWKNNEVAWANY